MYEQRLFILSVFGRDRYIFLDVWLGCRFRIFSSLKPYYVVHFMNYLSLFQKVKQHPDNYRPKRKNYLPALGKQ